MGDIQYTPPQGAFKASASPTEQLLQHLYGDLHQVIPAAVNAPDATISKVAKKFGVSHAWISLWLKRNGYVSQYVRQLEGGQPS